MTNNNILHEQFSNVKPPETLKQLRFIIKDPAYLDDLKLNTALAFVVKQRRTMAEQSGVLAELFKFDIKTACEAAGVGKGSNPVTMLCNELLADNCDAEDMLKKLITMASNLDRSISMFGEVIKTYKDTENSPTAIKIKKRQKCLDKFNKRK